jgi:hypothetical protein
MSRNKPQIHRKPTSPWFEKVPDDIRAMLTARASEDLPPLFVKRISARGEAAVPELINILIDLELSDEASPGGGWAPIHAAGLLGHLKATDAIAALLDVFMGVEIDDVLAGVSISSLIQMEGAAIAPILETVEGLDIESYPDHFAELVSALVELECSDERMTGYIDAVVGLSSVLGAVLLSAHYGEAAKERIANLMEAEPIEVAPLEVPPEAEGDEDLDEDEEDEEENEFAGMPHPYLELVAIYEELGGELTPAQIEKRDAALVWATEHGLALPGDGEEVDEEGDAAPAAKPAAAPPAGQRPGRNDDCWCGSGKKYKKCHIDADSAR